ncbi:MAG: FtsQ-type POTRA domain-containing protein [Clostridia bacterium]|nr:FtsQ-type POTRA domain-containing protein [Clostridia bacterium]MDE7328336.1 FtsQ-type POTRA domain-containing protein [Clostridia bacterium]
MHKRLWIILGVIASAVVLAVVLGTLFSIGKVEVNTTNDVTLTDTQKAEIIELSGIKKGKSIFSVDEDVAIKNIEVNKPPLKVISIERQFPNKVVVYVTQRTGIFSYRTEDGKYAILDRELKVIDIADQEDSSLTKLSGIPQENVNLGQVVDYKYGVLVNMIKGAEQCSFVQERFCTFFTAVEVSDNVINLKTNSGVVMQLPIASNIDEALQYCYSFYLNKLSVTGRSCGIIIYTNDGWKWELQ